MSHANSVSTISILCFTSSNKFITVGINIHLFFSSEITQIIWSQHKSSVDCLHQIKRNICMFYSLICSELITVYISSSVFVLSPYCSLSLYTHNSAKGLMICEAPFSLLSTFFSFTTLFWLNQTKMCYVRNSCSSEVWYPSIFWPTYLIQGRGGLQLILAHSGREAACTQERKSTLHLVDKECPIHLTCMYLDWGRKKEHLVKNNKTREIQVPYRGMAAVRFKEEDDLNFSTTVILFNSYF